MEPQHSGQARVTEGRPSIIARWRHMNQRSRTGMQMSVMGFVAWAFLWLTGNMYFVWTNSPVRLSFLLFVSGPAIISLFTITAAVFDLPSRLRQRAQVITWLAVGLHMAWGIYVSLHFPVDSRIIPFSIMYTMAICFLAGSIGLRGTLLFSLGFAASVTSVYLLMGEPFDTANKFCILFSLTTGLCCGGVNEFQIITKRKLRLARADLLEKNNELENAMREIQSRQEILATTFAHVNLGLCFIDKNRLLRIERSRFLENLIGNCQIEGRPAIHAIFAKTSLHVGELRALEAALTATLGEPSFVFESNRRHLPAQCVFHSPTGSRNIELEWVPMTDSEGAVYAILLLLRDVSAVRKLRRSADQRQRLLSTISEILPLDQRQLLKVLNDVQDILARLALISISREHSHISQGRQEFLKELYTQKGNCRVFGMLALAHSIHVLESILVDTSHTEKSGGHVMRGIRMCQRHIDRYQSAVSLIRGHRASWMEERTALADETLSLIWNFFQQENLLAQTNPSFWEQILGRIAQTRGIPLATLIGRLRDGARTLAQSLGQHEPQISVEDGGKVWVFTESAGDALTISLTQFMSNSQSHGFSTEQAGCVYIRLTRAESGEEVLLEYSTNEPGFDFEELRKKLSTENAEVRHIPEEQIITRLLRGGVSTQKTNSSSTGRGMGIAAAESAIHNVNGSIQFTLGVPNKKFKDRIPVTICITLPQKALLYSYQRQPVANIPQRLIA